MLDDVTTQNAKPRAKAKRAKVAASKTDAAKATAAIAPAVKATAKKTKAAQAPRAQKPSAARIDVEAAAAEAGDASFAEKAARNTLAVNPLIGVRLEDLRASAKILAAAAIKEPGHAGRRALSLLQEVSRIVKGESEVAPDPKDKRFVDPAWKSSWLHRGLLQTYVATNEALNGFIDDTGLSTRDKDRAKVVSSIFLDTIAPSNSLINPTALKRAVDTGGKSLVDGARHLIADIRSGSGLPSQVDKTPFKMGENICTSPGKVVFKNEVLELIQYECTSEKVWKRPLVVCPPQVNKFYALDLSPEKSFVKFAAAHGVQIFAVSWRNPTKEHSEWDLGTYVAALDHAVDAAREITGSADVNMWGACSGGMTLASYLGWLAAVDDRKVRSIVTPVCVLDATKALDTTMGLFATPESLKAVRAAVKFKGMVDGAEMARVFAWLRPNDLIWNYWVNNYLLGNKPPAFDILYWNDDTTRLPAAFHGDLLTIMEKLPFSKPGKMKVLGKPIDMRKVDVEAFVVAGLTDHITPWRACYETARIFGDKSTFVLANAGHLQSILNPPNAPKAFFSTARVGGENPDEWAVTAERREGSWWPLFIEWLSPRAGELVERPARLGSDKHKATVAAPGEYVLG